ncbi:hypothetical protein FRX31_020012 [Thalictrum thalictroides]|uniref:Uncharacterized protein n=1 Tax=Thalictrum thalictroides TaxID=46969 RepID=A0A7J6W1M0_THATH|nr:hypothetical protein FRX31_020012 [Thalictrum thalictroides]
MFVILRIHGGQRWWCANRVDQIQIGNVRDKCAGVFGGVGLKEMEGGKALIFFNSEKDMSKLLTRPPLSSWECFYTISQWHSSSGALKVKPEKIPRSITLEDNGEKYLIWVEVISEIVLSLAKMPGRLSTAEEGVLTDQGRRVKTADVAIYDPWNSSRVGPTRTTHYKVFRRKYYQFNTQISREGRIISTMG